MTTSFTQSLGNLTLCLATAGALSVTAGAQGFNLDFDDPQGLPANTCSATYAAAGTAGFWNPIDSAIPGMFSLKDKSGAATGVTMTTDIASPFSQNPPNPVYVGDDAKLMNDLTWNLALGGTINFAGLANGNYEVYTYAQAPDSKAAGLTDVNCANSLSGLQTIGGLWTGVHVQGSSYAKHLVSVTNGTLQITIAFIAYGESVNGVQLEPAAGDNPGSAYCFGDGTGASCPCSGFGVPGAGCANTGGGGAVMTGSGNGGFSNDTFKLDIVGVPGDKPGLVLKGDSQVAIPAGDGILCNTGNSMRSHVQVTSAGATTFTDFNGSPFGSVSNAGGVPTNFQFWYRDPANGCSGAGFNFTNGWTVTYVP